MMRSKASIPVVLERICAFKAKVGTGFGCKHTTRQEASLPGISDFIEPALAH